MEILKILAVMSLVLLEPVISETKDVCLGYDCLENVACPPDSSIDDDYYDDNIAFENYDLNEPERQIPNRFRRSVDQLFNKCCNIDKICKCNECNNLPKCNNTTHIPIRTRVAANSPGDCCDKYECQPAPKCSEESTGVSWRTECKDCKCMAGEELCSVVENCQFQPKEQPAACLSSELNKIFEHGEEWKEADDCMDCQCENGEKKCIRMDCKVPECANPVKVPGQCCKVCPVTEAPAGCFSTAVRKIFNHGEEWKESDDCMDCRCENGDIKCESSFCKPLDCVETVKIPGQCCRVCVEPPITDGPSEEAPIIHYDNILYCIYAAVILLIISITVIYFFCCRRHHQTVNGFVDRKFVATTNKYSTIQQSESTVTTAPSTPTMR